MQNARDCRDRTAEFFACVELEQSSGSWAAQPRSGFAQSSDATGDKAPLLPKGGPGQRRRQIQSPQAAQHNAFTKAAQQIGAGLAEVTQKLDRLGKLAKQKSLFNDPVHEIQDLTLIVKQDITTLNGEIDKLHEWQSSHKSGVRQSDTHSHAIVDNLKSKLASSTKQFTAILQTRTENLKSQSNRAKRFGSSKPKLRKRSNFAYDEDDRVGDIDSDAPDQMVQAQVTEEEDVYLAGQAATVENIESIIHELGGIYQRLATIVAEQNEMIIRIDSDVDHTRDNVESGNRELIKYFDSVSSSRWLILKVFAVLIIFSILFVLFVA